MNGLTVLRPLGLVFLMIVAGPIWGKAPPPEDLARIRDRIDPPPWDEWPPARATGSAMDGRPSPEIHTTITCEPLFDMLTIIDEISQ